MNTNKSGISTQTSEEGSDLEMPSRQTGSTKRQQLIRLKNMVPGGWRCDKHIDSVRPPISISALISPSCSLPLSSQNTPHPVQLALLHARCCYIGSVLVFPLKFILRKIGQQT